MAVDERYSRRADQADRLRQMMAGRDLRIPGPAPRAHVIAVTSGKGGVGKTFVACNLAIALAARGHRVVLFDVDMGLANADIVLGLEVQATWADMLGGRRSLDEVVIDGPGGIAFVPGASGIAHAADLSEFERHRLLAAMRRIESDYEIAVLDCGAGISRNVVAFASAADTVLVVASPEPTALTDAYATVKVFAQVWESGGDGAAPADVGVVVNQADSRGEARATYERLAETAARFLHLPVLDCGYVLRDDHVPAAVRQRRPLMLRYPRSPAGSCLLAVAGRLSREIGRRPAERGLFYRVMNLFL